MGATALFPKLKDATAAVMLALALASVSHAQQQPPAAADTSGSSDTKHGVGLSFGQVFLMGDLNTNFQNGIGFNLNYAFESGKTFGLLVNLHLNNHSGSSTSSSSSATGAVEESLSIKGLTPHLKMNLFSVDKATLAVFGGLGLYKISETRASLNASYTLFAIDAGAAVNVDLDPHFRFGPSIQFITLSSATDTAATTANGSTTAATIGGPMVELMFNVMYFF